MKRFSILAVVLMLGLSVGALSQDTDTAGGSPDGEVTLTVSETVSMEITTGATNFTNITEADIQAGTLANDGAFVIEVNAITNFTVDARLATVATTGGGSAPGAASLLLGASLAGGSGAVADTAFSAVPSTIALNTAFSGANNADGTGESSTIDLTIDMDQLGDREQNEVITYTLEFIVTET